ncbi:Fur family transcriptional regulator [Fluviispira vulneris]|uniref:Fur family transcriptional regulator n=1 Tax=Fluviispira vulneris TaxID=2763012 RepID=UPI0016464F50|nr:Fur family transcriptional regulator [Fluviispira vulneris]
MMNTHLHDHDHNYSHAHHAEGCSGKSFYDIAVSSLKEAKCRITKPRLAVIECLADSAVPLSPKSIYEKVQTKNNLNVDQVSVYRILEALTKLGLVHQVFPSGEYLSCNTRCEVNPNHVMLNCIQCGKVEEIHLDWSFIYKIFERVRRTSQFDAKKHMLQLDGICVKCQ